ncbi:MAG TPA: hypothetical protein DCP91_05570 [Eggerthellaceae bacterium]|nr:hypothetical protein [Eggerthellaceae bacterium]
MVEISIHVITTETVRQTDCRLLAERMPARFQRAMRYRFERDRLLCLGAGWLMMEALGVRDEREIRYGSYGKPYVPGKRAFSISHSGTCSILACGEAKRIGADIEEVDERNIDIASKVYTERELAWMDRDRVERFFRLWTWKECIMKATGMGFNLEPRSFEVLPFTVGQPTWVAGHRWHAWEGQLGQSRIAVCADEPIGQVHLVEYGKAQEADGAVAALRFVLKTSSTR